VGYTENNDPLYVVAIDAALARVTVGPKEALARDVVLLSSCNWLETLPPNLEIEVKLRSMTRPVTATLHQTGKETATLTLPEPQYGISPGQAAACYIGDRLIGGGWIDSTYQETNRMAVA
jgi:tRNA-specific 2-thiouridylase